MMGITVVGLGPGDGRFLTREAWQILTEAGTVHLRTKRHPAVADLPENVTLISFDGIYETAVNFESVYAQIVAELLRLAQTGPVVYAVPGHPHVGESTVTALETAAQEAGVPVRIVPGISFIEPMLTAVGYDGLDGLQLFDAVEMLAFHYPPLNPDVPLLLGQVYSRLVASDLKLVLTAVYPEEHPVYLIHAAGLDGQSVEQLPLYAIDHSEQTSHLTSLYVPALPYKASLPALAETVAILRSPEGCPWDREQTPQSMRADFLEEAGEVLEALDTFDDDGLREELGDMFYHLVMQTQMASEEEIFRLSDVIAGIEAKLKRRHPHVWGDWEAADTAAVLHNWEKIKQDEKGRQLDSILDHIPLTLPALARSQKIQHKVAKVGFDWPNIAGVYDKLREETAELQAANTPAERLAELGDILFVLVNLARWLGVDAESALREANLRFTRRFQAVEQLAAARQLDLTQMDLAAIEILWQEVKVALKAADLEENG
ncbi:MAG: nucleoside triphosphate pyrophosphohydrolase [Chloroflexi bacterium]|nr:nucleoside triphosphate pyrophosphohydrolase [Chloroflexota bacterium]MBK6710337.1 nucleoside triphosphate pyrophosphohydrolase [Chloroflexota bacterium]MBK7180047.1 nucleoside triphosphate pyrophosphohydrolase [Chloroflexota bacterium]MBK8934800.1 nucleoside triphosphate pyrophosphohydrolase [Chloroflexota bacterium]